MTAPGSPAVAAPRRRFTEFRSPLWLPKARPLRRVEVTAEGLTLLPRAFWSGGTAMRWSELRALQLVHLKKRTLLIIETARAQFVVVSTEPNDASLGRVRDAVFETLPAGPNTSALLARSAGQALATSAVLNRGMTVTWALTIITAICFGVEVGLRVVGNPLRLVSAGGNAPVLVAEGQYDRLLTATFLHASFLHVYLNALALIAIGSTLERLLGSARFLLVALLAGFAAQLASTFAARSLVSVGASGMVFGLLGGFAVLHLAGRALPSALRARPRWWVMVLAINAAIPVLVPIVDWVAHLGGMVAGALVTWAMLTPQRGPLGTSATMRWASGLLVGVHMAALVALLTRAREDPKTTLLAASLRVPHPNAQMTNDLAWNVAIDPGASSTQIELGSRVAKRTLQLSAVSDIAEKEDTLAELEYRLGHLDEAVRLEASAMRRVPKPFFATQLARFALARRAPTSSAARAGPLTDIIDGLALERRDGRAGGARLISLQRGADPAVPLLIYAATMSERDELTGLAVLCAGRASRVVVQLPDAARAPPIAERLLPLVVEADGCADPSPESMTVKWYAADKGAMVLP